ncbi:MAG: hypothetical protein A2504_08045 [Bdellovibrionales bacterium RIFOXYD12_FULL_39_22]|nr:MAG: hypothetical protein A2385_13670 [Bdellovibrionales bacterium RIFOXYB1_FULL_39_21]OFZ44882.1 MAG: hypothetical protein A2485_14880 [Bdellovibrionales bacterium RIFOXYC12_FULL_39_17]OFZ49400.1 MAG: hypothetical protein A2404_09215 [Bdellovibrionales bacterium RIFOXYC1_FULL_39_130]OFZ77121.1 MAG: hypothetical protein A2560_10865 [Bdellovibrionales bacterium RIFOXYD1_FULL_39_84]OFZ95582.1 MAG: hypothetical protein A2504_08045 [Bdellovibrionales bacterium RIFOXYD12_FULL_39_22]
MKAFINKDASGHCAEKKLKDVSLSCPFVICSSAEINNCLHSFCNLEKNPQVILGGGDGTFHLTLNSLFDHAALQWKYAGIEFAFLGLGSSNSFIRSLKEATNSTKTPCTSVDLGYAKITNSKGETLRRIFLANGSLGFLALGNLIFNQENLIPAFLKRMGVEIANFVCFFLTLFKFTPIKLEIKIQGQTITQSFLNFQFLKAHFYTGGFKFPPQNNFDNGKFDIHWDIFSSKWGILKNFIFLSLNQLSWMKAHHNTTSNTFVIKSPTDIPLELDGEIYFGNYFEISCLSKQLKLFYNWSTS